MSYKCTALIDHDPTDKENVFSFLHLRAYHTTEMFSKFEFKDGKYGKLKVDKENSLRSKYYALRFGTKCTFNVK
jgi:hypothetical protein